MWSQSQKCIYNLSPKQRHCESEQGTTDACFQGTGLLWGCLGQSRSLVTLLVPALWLSAPLWSYLCLTHVMCSSALITHDVLLMILWLQLLQLWIPLPGILWHWLGRQLVLSLPYRPSLSVVYLWTRSVYSGVSQWPPLPWFGFLYSTSNFFRALQPIIYLGPSFAFLC